MIIRFALFGRQILSFELGRRFTVIAGPDGPLIVNLGGLIELAGEDPEDDEAAPEEERLAYGFGPGSQAQ